MKITDEMVEAARNTWFGGPLEERHKSLAYAKFIRKQLESALTAALATQPDRYREGFERAREMAAEKVGWYCARSGDACANAIRSMEMPDE